MDHDRDVELPRRKLLKRIALGGGALASLTVLPQSWIKPVVDIIVVPAHAAQAVSGPSASPSLSLV